jgi:hypothetical protein
MHDNAHLIAHPEAAPQKKVTRNGADCGVWGRGRFTSLFPSFPLGGSRLYQFRHEDQRDRIVPPAFLIFRKPVTKRVMVLGQTVLTHQPQLHRSP